jgi:hypothetical protein
MTTTPSRLWALAPLTATCAALLLIPLRDPLAWWHLFWGRTISGLNAIPAANHVRYALDELAPALHPTWLADLSLWSVYDLGGLPLLLTLRALWLAAALAAITLATRRLTSGPVAALLSLVGLAIALPAAEPGPALLAAPLIALLATAAQGRSLLWAAVLPLTSALWANLDPAIWLIPTLGAGALLAQPAGRPRLVWAAAWLASLAAPLANPRGISLMSHLLDVARLWPSSPSLGPSWASLPVSSTGLTVALILLALAIAPRLISALRAGERGAAAPLVFLAALAAQALWTQRGLVWLGVALPWIIAHALPAAARTALDRPALPWWGKAPLAAGALIAALALQPTWLYHPELALAWSPYKLRPAQPYAALVLSDTPIEGLALLRPYPKKPALWIEPRWAGLALLTLEPAPPATPTPLIQTDPRPELGLPAHRELERLAMTSDVWRGAFQQYNVRAALLDLRGEGRYLGDALLRQPGWHPAHQTEDYVLFLRR